MKSAFVLALGASLAAASPALEARASASSSGTGTGTSSGSLPTVTVKGNAFFAGNNRFYIRGIDYQPGGSSDAKDPLADTETCQRDIKYFKQLGINTIRVYTVDNSANHDTCMSALADAGIYVALDVNTPKYSLNRANPAVSYNAVYLQSIFATVDVFAKYTNTLVFFSGNEVINDDETTGCAPYIKAVTRDLKQYRDNRGYRQIPIGYSAADVDSSRYEMADYMNCGTDDERADFFANNDYAWCSPSSYTQSGWSTKVQKFGNYSLPIFLSEYGCIAGQTRDFSEVAALYSSNMTGVFSGGLVYEYSEEGSGYGLVQIDGDTISPKPGFTALQNAFKNTPAPSGDGGYRSSGSPSECPAESTTWQVKDFKGAALPAIPAGAKKYMTSGAGAGPGLTGDGSQNAGDGIVSTASAGSGSATRTASGGSATGKAGASSTQTGAASRVNVGEVSFAPLVMTGVVALSALLGAALL